jgi:hypothetical protein
MEINLQSLIAIFTFHQLIFSFEDLLADQLITYFREIRLKYNYPKVEYSEAGILNDTKNILH